jgi:two-component system, OmpR family, sensor histidine kinase KdpD
LAAAKWAWEKNRPAGRDSDALPGARWLFIPLRTGRGQIGILGICRVGPGPLLRAEQRRLLDALSDQGALAIERVHLVEDIESVRRVAETDRLRSALLTSISHDLKTPLASVLGAAGALRDLSKSFDDDAKAELLTTIIDESERLNRFIANLLDMTKLESGAVVPNAALHDIGEIVGSALERASKILAKHRVEMEISPDLPMVSVDAVLFEQVLFNLLDNAAKYAPPDTTVRLQSWQEGDSVRLQILDEGDGVPSSDLERIFDKFYRSRKGDQVRAGTGLGLAISRGFVEAMGGTITAANRTDRTGAVFTITLPVPEPAEQEKVAA